MREHSPELAQSPKGYYANLITTARAVEDTYTRLFPKFLQTYSSTLFNASQPAPTVVGATVTLEPRYTMDKVIFFLTLVLLFFFALVVVATYFLRPGRFLKQLPTSLEKTIPLVSNGKVVEEMAPMLGMGQVERMVLLEEMGWTFGFGWFWGRDGGKHYGVDRDPVVRVGKW